VPPTAPIPTPVPAPGRYDARKATRLQRAQRLADLGWAALDPDQREYLDALYWGDAQAWPPQAQIVHHDPLGGADEAPLDVPSMGIRSGLDAYRVAPMLMGVADPEPASAHRFQRFLAFWRWWVAQGQPTLTATGELALEPGKLQGAPLIRVVPKRPAAKRLFFARLIEEIQALDADVAREEADATPPA
jgi:hypothetical protein